MQRLVYDCHRAENHRDPVGETDADELFAMVYGMIDRHMCEKTWSLGYTFSIADSAAAPALFFADIIVPFPESQKALHA
jgi:glutathione S-transferase